MPLLIIISAFALFFLGLFLYEQKRIKTLSGMAQGMGMEFSAADPEKQWRKRMEQFALGEKARRRKCSNILQATLNGEQTVLMDYYFQVGSGKTATRKHQTVALYSHPEWQLVTFMMRPENFSDRISKWLGKDDIDFDDAPEFSRRYHLTGPDIAAIRQVFSPELRNFFEERTGWYIECRSHQILICQVGHRQKPKEIIHLLQSTLNMKQKLLEANSSL